MKRFLTGLLALGLAVVLTSNAQAGLLTTVVSYDGTVDVFDDDSNAFVIDDPLSTGVGVGSVSMGDFIVGILRVGGTTATGPLAATDQLIGLFSFRVVSSTGVAGADPTVTITHAGVDPSANTGFSIDELLGVADGTFGAGAMIAILSDTGNSQDPTDLTFGAALTAITSGSYMLDMVLGISTAVDYLEIQSFRDFNDSGELDFSEFPADSPAGTFLGNEAGGLSVLFSTFSSDVEFLPITSVHTDGSTITLHDVGVSGSVFGRRSDTPTGYSITDSTVLAINPTPEPASITLFGLGLLGIGCAGYRRRRKEKKSAA